MKYTLLILSFLFSKMLFGQLEDTRATISADGLTAKAYVKATNAINFPNTNNNVSMDIAFSLPANGETDPNEAPAFVSATTPLPGLVVVAIDPEVWNDRFVYTFQITGQTPLRPSWPANSENLIMEVLFASGASGDVPRLDHLVNSGGDLGCGMNGHSCYYFEVLGNDRTNYNDPFYNGLEGSYDTDDLWVESLSALPITLISLEAKKFNNRSSQITWTTSSELNSSHFNVQRSTDSHNWVNVGKVSAQGNSQVIRNYEFLDVDVYNGKDPKLTVFYRLQMVDIDGQNKISPIRSVVFGTETPSTREILAYPNPASDGIQVEWDIDQANQPTSIELFDIDGKLVYTSKVDPNSNQEYIDFSFTDVQSGLYLLRLMNGKEPIETKQIVVQR